MVLLPTNLNNINKRKKAVKIIYKIYMILEENIHGIFWGCLLLANAEKW